MATPDRDARTADRGAPWSAPGGWSAPEDWMRPLGGSGVSVSAISLGGAPLGSMPQNFGYEVSAEQAVALVRAVLASPVRTIDTANGYSGGESERRIGAGIAAAGGLPDDVVVVTKVDARDGDYSGDRVRASVEESRSRLGLDHLPLVHLHDPEFHSWDSVTAPGGAVDALVALKEAGRVGSIGLAGGHVPTVSRCLDLGVFDVLLVHNRLTLVDRSADELVERARGRGIGVVNAAVYGGGILAQPAGASSTYGYRAAPPEVLVAITAMRAACERHGTDLATAALQSSLRDERVDSTIVGISKPERLASTLRSAAESLPSELWDELAEPLPPPSAWLDPPPSAGG